GIALIWCGEFCRNLPFFQNVFLLTGGILSGIALAKMQFVPQRKKWQTLLCFAAMLSLIWHWWVWAIVLPAAWAAHRAPKGWRRQLRIAVIFGAVAVIAAGVRIGAPGILDGTWRYGWILCLCLCCGAGMICAAGRAALRWKMVCWIGCGLFLAWLLLQWGAWYVWNRSALTLCGGAGIVFFCWLGGIFRGRLFRRYGIWAVLLPLAAALLALEQDLRRFGSFECSWRHLEAGRSDAADAIKPVRQWYLQHGRWPTVPEVTRILPEKFPKGSFEADGYFYLTVRAVPHRPLIFYRFSANPAEDGLVVWSKRFPAQELRVPVNFSYPDRDFRKKQ
ncbi:MAG: hypothetical protein J6R85_01685, partial [Lentisphaeria bacterium]|nr:hypothetical protein [Lentisphaeria bacterium]